MPEPRSIALLSIHPLYDTRIGNHIRTLLNGGWSVSYLNQSPDASHQPAGFEHERFELKHRAESNVFGMSVPRYRRMLKWMVAQSAALRDLEEGPPAIVHLHDLLLLPALPRLKRALPDAKFVFDVHEHYHRNPGVMGRFARWCYKRYAHHFDAFVGESETVLEPLPGVPPVELADAGESRLIAKVLVPNYQSPLDYQAFLDAQGGVKPSLNDGAIRIVYFGDLAPDRRDTFTMLDAIAQVLRDSPSTRFRVGGPLVGPAGAAVKARLDELADELGDRFRFEGVVPRSTVCAATAEADIGLMLLASTHPNLGRCSPNKIYEYLFTGTAGIGTWGFENDKTLAERGAVKLFEPGAEADLIAKAILELIHHPQPLRDMQQTASRLAPGYAWESIADRYLGLYDALLSGSA